MQQYYHFGKLILGLALCSAVATSQKGYEEIIAEEVLRSSNGSVPNYKIVPIYWPKNQKRGTVDPRFTVYLKPFDENIQLYLNPVEGVLSGINTPIYSVKSSYYGPQFFLYTNIIEGEAIELYEDPNTDTTFSVVNSIGGRKRITGYIGYQNLVIIPIPESLADNFTEYRKSIDNIPEMEIENYHYHIIYKTSESSDNRTFNIQPQRLLSKSKRNIPDVVYPEVLVIVDYSLYKILQMNRLYALSYILAFWNGVDLKYRYLENPKYRFNVAGIIFAEDDEVLNYLHANKWNSQMFDQSAALAAFGPWLIEQNKYININSYDMAVTLTAYDLCHKRVGLLYASCDVVGSAGIAFLSKACDGSYYGSLAKTAIVHDHGGYAGIHIAAHEVGHLLGAEHDGESYNTWSCLPNTGHIMSPTATFTQARKSFEFSHCTLQRFQRFLESGDAACLYNKPNPGSVFDRFLPGQFQDADQQCERLHNGKAAVIDHTICKQLKCISGPYYSYTLIRSSSAAAEGTPCGFNQICLHGQCISVHKK